MEIHKKFQGLELTARTDKLKDASLTVEGKFEGEVEVKCIKCLHTFKKKIDEEVKFKIVKPPFKGFDENYDIIEMEKIDLNILLESEVESIRNDYNICPECEKKEFDQEF